MRKVEVLYFEGCPNRDATAQLARQVIRDLGVEAEITEVEVANVEDAQRLRFLGSPTVQVDGVDIEPGAGSSTDYAFACRVYGDTGVPPREMLVAALNSGATATHSTEDGMSESCGQNDLVSRNSFWLLWGLPIGMVLIGGLIGATARALLWTPAFLMMGCACVVNAVRCGRLHCYITGPVFLLAAVASLLVGLDVLVLPWRWIGLGALGGTALAYIAEWISGKYLSLPAHEGGGS
jgi:hypothetical protein